MYNFKWFSCKVFISFHFFVCRSARFSGMLVYYSKFVFHSPNDSLALQFEAIVGLVTDICVGEFALRVSSLVSHQLFSCVTFLRRTLLGSWTWGSCEPAFRWSLGFVPFGFASWLPLRLGPWRRGSGHRRTSLKFLGPCGPCCTMEWSAWWSRFDRHVQRIGRAGWVLRCSDGRCLSCGSWSFRCERFRFRSLMSSKRMTMSLMRKMTSWKS